MQAALDKTFGDIHVQFEQQARMYVQPHRWWMPGCVYRWLLRRLVAVTLWVPNMVIVGPAHTDSAQNSTRLT